MGGELLGGGGEVGPGAVGGIVSGASNFSPRDSLLVPPFLPDLSLGLLTVVLASLCAGAGGNVSPVVVATTCS